ncbi:Thiamine pathway transporter [Trichophyton interdigitale]|uniref:Thiamine pathway transporter n=1 Tax=Trichophyton interdigitale TaxID=101480 RepID=A0A9P4YKH1_9EURO|nr:Thiamine pathway transporter [Trichophyton interdigitale]KAG5210071.1 Thiamine pathway transporter [Trichophyton interdigitale]KAG8207232.1 Thiamine pathway transporter [Trichophyton interdigitale]
MDEKVNPRPADADAAYNFLHEHNIDLSSVDEKALLRKIDWMIVPLMWACYNLQYVDKVLINFASIMGLLEDAHLDTNQYSYLGLAFYVSYLFFELPTGYLMQRLPTAKYLGANLILWGTVVALNCAAKNFAGLLVLRLLLGCFEASVAPSLILITGMWYKKKEQPARMGFWYSGTGTATIIGALSAYGLLFYTGERFKPWQVMFLIFGLITIFTGILVVLFLPDNPMTSRLTEAEKVYAIERLRENQTGVENKHFKIKQFKEVFEDPQTYLLTLITTAGLVPNAAISQFQSLIIKAIGYTPKQTQLLSIPSGVVNMIAIVAATLLAARFGKRTLFMVAVLIPSLLGACMLAFFDNTHPAAKLAGNYLTHCNNAFLPLTYSIITANYAGHTKKVTMNAIILMAFCLGNILGPLTFKDKDAPEYVPAKLTIVVTMSITIVSIFVLRLYYKYENKRRDRKLEEGQVQPAADFLDITDRENLSFRVSYASSIPLVLTLNIKIIILVRILNMVSCSQCPKRPWLCTHW